MYVCDFSVDDTMASTKTVVPSNTKFDVTAQLEMFRVSVLCDDHCVVPNQRSLVRRADATHCTYILLLHLREEQGEKYWIDL